MNKQTIFNTARMVRQSFKARAGRLSAKAAGVFALAYGAGAIVAFIVNGILPLNVWLAFLNIGLYGNVTVTTVVIGTIFTYPLLVYFNRYGRTQD